MTFTLEELVALASEALDAELTQADDHLSLSDLGFDSLSLTVMSVAINERFPFMEMPATDGLIDPSWTLAELHHLIAAEVERYA